MVTSSVTVLEAAMCVSVKLQLRHRRTNRRLFVCLSVRCVCLERPSYGWMKRDASWKLKVGGGGGNTRDEPTNTRNLVT